MSEKGKMSDVHDELSPSWEGSGPLLQRDYWAVFRACPLTCREVIRLVREQFCTFPPETLAVFRRADHENGPINIGERLQVKITMTGNTSVRVMHVDSNSFTLGTERSHPENGRITFGTYHSLHGDIIFHIRSRARSNSSMEYIGFLTAGEPMQTNTWTDFIDRLAQTVAEGIIGAIHTGTKEVQEGKETEAMNSPTFIARGN